MLTLDQRIELGQQLMACRDARWMPGMLALQVKAPRFLGETYAHDRIGTRFRVVDVLEVCVCGYNATFNTNSPYFVPDLNDPATRGCALELVRDAWKDPAMFLQPLMEYGGSYWLMWHIDETLHAQAGKLPRATGSSEAETLVAAMVAVTAANPGSPKLEEP